MIEINLLLQRKKRKVPAVMGLDFSAINLKMVGLGLILYFAQDMFIPPYTAELEQAVQDQINTAQTELAALKAELRQHAKVKERLQAYERRVNELKKRSEYVDQILKARTNPKKLLEKIARSVPDDMWFEKIILGDNRQITISGRAEAYKSIGDFLTLANDSAFFGKSLTLASSATMDEMLYGKRKRVEVYEIKGTIETFDPWQGNSTP